jgi:hypothetical protein
MSRSAQKAEVDECDLRQRCLLREIFVCIGSFSLCFLLDLESSSPSLWALNLLSLDKALFPLLLFIISWLPQVANIIRYLFGEQAKPMPLTQEADLQACLLRSFGASKGTLFAFIHGVRDHGFLRRRVNTHNFFNGSGVDHY